MPRTLRKRPKRQKDAKQEEKTLKSRLLQISVVMDAYIYYKRAIQSSKARTYLQELHIYEEQSHLDMRSKQVVEKLVNFMQRIIEEEAEELRANETLGNFEPAAFASKSVSENCMQTLSFPENPPSSPFNLNRLDGPEGNNENMNDENLDINGNEKNCSQLNPSHGIQRSDSFQTNNDQVTLLSQSVLRDHNYTSWEGPKHFQEPVSKAIVGTPRRPRSFAGYAQKNIMILPYQCPSLAKKYVLVKIPVGNRPKTPSPAKYIKINPSPRRELNVPPNYASTSKESSKKVMFRNANPTFGLPVNNSQKCTKERMSPKTPALPIAIESKNIEEDDNSKTYKNKKNTSSKLLSHEEKEIKQPKNKAKRNVSQETNVTDCRKKKRNKNKLKPNEEDLSWVENLKFVRVIEKDEACTPNMSLTDAFWKNLDYPPDWDEGVYLM